MALDLNAAKRFRNTMQTDMRKTKKPVMPWEDRVANTPAHEQESEKNQDNIEKKLDSNTERISKESKTDSNIIENKNENIQNKIEIYDGSNTNKFKIKKDTISNQIRKSSESNQIQTKTDDEPVQNKFKKPQSFERQELEDFSDLQKDILRYLFERSDQQTRVTQRMRSAEIAQALQRTPASVKSTLNNLAKMDCIERSAWKNGVQGWTKYRLSEKVAALFASDPR
jgi:hypothetical protein